MVTKKSPKRPTRRRTRRNKANVVGYVPRVVVQFHDYVKLPYRDGIERVIKRLKLAPWAELSKTFPGITFKRMFTSVTPGRIRELIKRATEMKHDYKPVNFLAYFVMNAPPGVDPRVLAKALRAWPIVKTAYYDPPGGDPVVDPSGDVNSEFQGYLDPAPEGIDAEFAWTFQGGDGEGINIIDMEQGWTLDHDDLVEHGAMLLHGEIFDASRQHGTSVLGVICARDNNIGCVGICPNVNSVNVVSYNGSTTRTNAMMTAIDTLSFGDILLLEAHVDLDDGPPRMPIEVFPAEFGVIQLAIASGFVVVEAGGNGGNDLDAYVDDAGNQLFNRSFRDSGAIIVGAASWSLPHFRSTDSNFGDRIDCYGWGNGVETCNSDEMGATTDYRSDFNGTSSAAAIVAGAALAVQGIAVARGLGRFSPTQLRDILKDPDLGTESGDPKTDLIGVMPDLKKIISGVLNAPPDVYIRDFVGDIGNAHTDFVSASPDIILRPTAVTNPEGLFGEGSGTANSDTLGFEAIAGQDNFIHVRVRNRGGSPATNVVATVYWSPVSTLVTPDLWTLVGSVTIPNVAEADILTVSDAITWNEGEIPATGHYCFVGIVGTAGDTPPELPSFANFDDFIEFIRAENNVTWRNFNVVDNDPPAPRRGLAPFVELPFLAPGAPDVGRAMHLEIVAKLPRGSRLFLEAPRAFGDHMRVHAPFNPHKRGRVQLPCNPQGRQKFNEMVFPAKSRTKLKLLVHIPKEFRDNPYQLYARQLYRNREVGRVTWRLVPRKFFKDRESTKRKKPAKDKS